MANIVNVNEKIYALHYFVSIIVLFYVNMNLFCCFCGLNDFFFACTLDKYKIIK